MTPNKFKSMPKEIDHENLMYQFANDMLSPDFEDELPAKDRFKARLRRYNKEKEKKRSQQVAGYLISQYWNLSTNATKEEEKKLGIRVSKAKNLALKYVF